MDTNSIMAFLNGITANNNKEWFQAHRDEYEACRKDFQHDVERLISAISAFDPSISWLKPKDCIYRFNRDIRFSPDKSPYKRHFGAYLTAHGKKSLMGGYYIHVQPGQCLYSVGAYWLPTNILTSCRNEIMTGIDAWRKAVESPAFLRLYGRPAGGVWDESSDILSPKGFGIAHLKTAPKDFPRDYEFIQYIRMKDYATWHRVADDYFAGDRWIDDAVKNFRVAKPMLDIINSVIADYE